ncbi:MAG: ATP-binding protein [Planctomycetota bacterium]
MCKRLSFDLRSTRDSINRAAVMLSDFFDKQGLSDDVTFDIKLATQEAVVNAAEHGNHYDGGKWVHICCETSDSAVTVTVCDEGPGFDPRCVPDPTLPENIFREGGRGVFLMRNLCDDVCFNDKGNQVTIVKKIAKNEQT